MAKGCAKDAVSGGAGLYAEVRAGSYAWNMFKESAIVSERRYDRFKCARG